MPPLTACAATRVAALPNAAGPICTRFLNVFSLNPLIKAARSIVRNNSGTRLRIRAQVDWDAPKFHVAIEGARGPAWTVNVQGPYQDGPLALRVNYQKVFPDGRAEDHWVYTNYWTPPPTYIPPKPSG